ncbi:MULTISPECIES: EAL domain-containing protein [Cyanophyceae]|uniref:EAL domain-containing protein n=1 Tax=Cyanophyceae TaxID=3028117 RepID=UPI001686C815|nr:MULTISPECIES: EAL domain-containing protein [Cyanophyceae]MBD1915491.1 EAL domain-containing protein [Phormidium sp. FACHB-77]MBD2031801.1 EAL domain-containing protein [Phormidium sp. FACHB-322]MBD2050551.1 EAL domain-containing protein [Leptolyngbya sp. FACHB-60]
MRFTFSNQLRRGIESLLTLATASLLVVSLSELGLLMPLVQAEYGLRFRLRGQRPWADQVVLIAIDEPSLDALGAFPWPRRRYAELMQGLQAASPQAVVFDLLFVEPSPDDAVFVEAIAAHPAVILASAWDRDGQPLGPTPTLAKAALTTGHILQRYQGGYIHSVEPMVSRQPALAIATAEALSLTQQAVSLPPLDRPLWVNWPGVATALPTYSFVDVLEGRVPPQVFKGKVVLIGATALGLDDRVTPFDAYPPASGVFLHGALIDNLLHQRWLRPLTGGWIGAIALALALSLGLQRQPGVFWRQGVLMSGLVAGWWGTALVLMGANLWLPVVGPVLLLSAVGGLSLGQQWLRQNRWLRQMTTALQHRHPPEVLLPEPSPSPATLAQPGFIPGDRVSDLTQLVELTEQLGRSQAVQAAIARSLPLGLVAAAADGTVWFANPLATEWLGLAAGDRLASALPPDWFEVKAWEQLWERVCRGQAVAHQLRQRGDRWYELRLESLAVNDNTPADWPQGAIVLFEDITYRQQMESELRRLNDSLETKVEVRTRQLEQLNRSLQEQIAERQLAQHQLAYEALHDPLTGLPNRRQFLSRLGEQFGLPEPGLYAVLFLDCDRFKLINDTFGHWVGDELLKRVATIVQECVRPNDVVARFGGDEFTILLTTLDQMGDAIAVAQRIRQRFTEALHIQEHQLFTNTSIGIVMGGPDYQHPDELLRDADTAMYQAKINNQGYALFEPGMHLDVCRSLQIETALRLALERQEFQLHYQPIVNLDTQQLMGCEALLRWLHPDRGLMFPDEFIAIAENTGMMAAIGAWVLREACTQMQRWRRRSLINADAVVSVNLSALQFAQPDFLAQVDSALNDSGLPAANLKLEITETVVIQNPEQVVPIIQTLRDRGIRLSIDDFGTGYSSLGYLQQLPVDILKIDRSFIANIHHSPQQYGIVETIIHLATHLNIQVIAEGIEQFPQLESLTQLGCKFGQGFFFARPLSVSQFSQYLRGRDNGEGGW